MPAVGERDFARNAVWNGYCWLPMDDLQNYPQTLWALQVQQAQQAQQAQQQLPANAYHSAQHLSSMGWGAQQALYDPATRNVSDPALAAEPQPDPVLLLLRRK